MKRVTQGVLEDFLRTLTDFDVRLPVRLSDGTRLWGRPQEGTIALAGGEVPRRPTEHFFPQHGLVFVARQTEAQSPRSPEKSLLLAGLTPGDLEALAFVDAFFAAGERDDLYFSRRERAILVGVSGECGREGALLPVTGGGCDLELIAEGEGWFVAPYTEAGKSLEERMTGKFAPFPERLRREPAADREDRDVLRRASALLLEDRVPDSFWQEIADRCIACTGCTLVCPTCTCFGIQDRCWPDRTERSRMWDSCQLDGYAREASGHNPLGTEALRTRRRIHHKLAADVRRWGRITCVACGRCETACPTGIGLLSVARELVARFDQG